MSEFTYSRTSPDDYIEQQKHEGVTPLGILTGIISQELPHVTDERILKRVPDKQLLMSIFFMLN